MASLVVAQLVLGQLTGPVALGGAALLGGGVFAASLRALDRRMDLGFAGYLARVF